MDIESWIRLRSQSYSSPTWLRKTTFFQTRSFLSSYYYISYTLHQCTNRVHAAVQVHHLTSPDFQEGVTYRLTHWVRLSLWHSSKITNLLSKILCFFLQPAKLIVHLGCQLQVCWHKIFQWGQFIPVAYPGILFVGGGFNKFSWGQRTERTGIWGR